MNLFVVESVVRRLFSDEAFRARAVADPATVLSEYRLTADERAALSKLCVQMADGPQAQIRPQGVWM